MHKFCVKILDLKSRLGNYLRVGNSSTRANTIQGVSDTP